LNHQDLDLSGSFAFYVLVVRDRGPAEAFFGLGSASVEGVEVRWPSGARSTVGAPAAGALVVEEGSPLGAPGRNALE
jgi:hypothetical protein